MDTEEEAVAYDRMDHSEVNRLFIDRFVELCPAGGRVLDVGTGPAHIPLELLRRGDRWNVVALDAAHHMLKLADEHVTRLGARRRLRLLLTDAKRLPFPDGSFDAVMSNSIVHHIPEPLAVFREIRRVLKPSGALLLRDLRRPKDERELDHLVATYAGDAEERQRGLFRDSLHAAFTLDEVKGLLANACFADLDVHLSSDRHWTAQRPARVSRPA